jgi:hypothetical protein
LRNQREHGGAFRAADLERIFRHFVLWQKIFGGTSLALNDHFKTPLVGKNAYVASKTQRDVANEVGLVVPA